MADSFGTHGLATFHAGGHLLRASAAALDLCELPPTGRLILDLGSNPQPTADGIAAALGLNMPTEPNTVSVGEPLVAWLRPGRYLLLTAADQSEKLLTRLRELARPAGGHCIDVGASQVTFRLCGCAATDCLAAMVAIDLRETALGVGACAQTRLLRAQVLIMRSPDGVGFDIHVDRSLSAYAWNAILRAGREFGLDQPTRMTNS